MLLTSAVIAAPAPFLFVAASNTSEVTAWAAILTGIASVLASTAVLIGQIRTRREVTAVHEVAKDVKVAVEDVKEQTTTTNGRTIAQLVETVAATLPPENGGT